jgi:hypothetical protein
LQRLLASLTIRAGCVLRCPGRDRDGNSPGAVRCRSHIRLMALRCDCLVPSSLTTTADRTADLLLSGSANDPTRSRESRASDPRSSHSPAWTSSGSAPIFTIRSTGCGPNSRRSLIRPTRPSGWSRDFRDCLLAPDLDAKPRCLQVVELASPARARFGSIFCLASRGFGK